MVAQRLLTRYRDELRPLYLMLYLENVLSYAAPKYEDRGIEARFAAMLEFVDLCLAPEQSVSEQTTTSKLSLANWPSAVASPRSNRKR